MSVVVTVQSGFDLEYYLAQAGIEPERSPGGYYINASIRGEAPGRWFGAGAVALGLTGEVDPDAYRQLYNLADTRTGERLGGARRKFSRSFEARLARLRAAEPYATADRVHQLELQARRDTRQSPAYTDVTVNFSKPGRSRPQGTGSARRSPSVRVEPRPVARYVLETSCRRIRAFPPDRFLPWASFSRSPPGS